VKPSGHGKTLSGSAASSSVAVLTVRGIHHHIQSIAILNVILVGTKKASPQARVVQLHVAEHVQSHR
jgi:hypothetical protein